MPELTFQVLGAEVAGGAAIPGVELQLEIANTLAGERIQTIVLRCQVQLEAPRRKYTEAEQAKLHDLFGEPERWRQTLRPLLWSNAAITVPAFSDTTTVALPLPCTFDFNTNTAKYFQGIEDGTVPLTLMFSGTAFFQAADNPLQAAPISWSSQARFAFPVELWKQCRDLYYPNTAYLSLRRDLFERLCEFKMRHGLATFDEAIEHAFDARMEAVR